MEKRTYLRVNTSLCSWDIAAQLFVFFCTSLWDKISKNSLNLATFIAKPLYLKRKHQFYTSSQSWKQVVDVSSQDRISVGYIILDRIYYGQLFIGSKLILVQRNRTLVIRSMKILTEIRFSQPMLYYFLNTLCIFVMKLLCVLMS